MEQRYKIKLSEAAQVKDFVHMAEKCDFDVDVFYNRVIIDAKSILGVLSMDLSKVLTVRCAGKNTDFEAGIQKYCVA